MFRIPIKFQKHRHQLMTLAVGSWIFVQFGCDTNLKVKLAPEIPCTNDDDCPKIESFHPQTAMAGDVISFKGRRFNRFMVLMANGTEVKPKLDSRGEGSFVVPEGVAGVVDVKVKVFETEVAGGGFIRLAGDHPVFTGDLSLICQGTKVYDSEGALQEGTKICPLLPDSCQTDGQTECVANENFKAVDMSLAVPANIKEGLSIAGVSGALAAAAPLPDNLIPSNIIAGVTIAGVTGTAITEGHSECAVDGAVGCISSRSFPAAQTAELASKVLSGQTVAGVAGNVTLPQASNVLAGSGGYGVAGASLTPSYSPDFPDVAHVFSSDTVNGAAGTLTLPSVNKVLSSVTYGIGGNGSTGTYTSPDFPDVSNVLSSDTVNNVAGTLTLPPVAQVLSGVT